MNRRVLRNAVITLSVLAAVAVVTTLVRSGPPPSAIGRTDQNLSAGVHTLDLVALETAGNGPARLPRISITLPSGWRSYGGWVVQKFRGGKEVMAVSFWDVNLVYPTPCRWESRPMVWPGVTVASLASTLAKQPLRNATAPTDAALGGFHGKYLQWSVPTDIAFDEKRRSEALFPGCDQKTFQSWTGLGWSGDRYEQGPGQVDRLWILKVEGQRLVVDATYLPAATANDRAELDRVVHSIKFLSDSPRKPASAASDGDHSVKLQLLRRTQRTVRNGEWIAYSTAPPGDPNAPGPHGPYGSDVFMTRAGAHSKLVAGRGSRGEIWNVCPAFSPNGRLLAFARKAPAGSTIVVVRVGLHGPIGGGRLVLKVPGSQGRCPRWSSNSSRLAYLDRGRVVVRGLDGSRRHPTAGDPTIHDFDRNKAEIPSPTGDLIARSGPAPNYGIVVSRPDGLARRIIKDDPPSYAIAGWSPDGRKLLLMRDVGGGFRMRAVSVVPPFASETIVAYVRVNNERSWPGYGDVSWQPIPPASARSAHTERLAQGRPGSAPGCAELGKLKAVFPAARAVGFTQRHQIMVQAARDPVFPGRCGAFWTTYKGRHGKEMDVMVTLYKASKDVRAALAEPAFGEIHRLSNGARVRTGSFHGAVNGTPSLSTNAVSAFRKLFISSTSISTSMTPVAISVQLRLHRHIENAFARLQVTH